ncbi:MAG TPA: response regulator [Caldilineaceae bacterium]|nr:response regulator [Caldilineaceae bacterium]
MEEARTILVVEDDRIARMALEEIFDLLGYRSLMAANGEEALALYTRHAAEIGLVLSDMKMPRMSGLELYQKLKALNPNIKMVLSTGFSEQERSVPEAEGIRAWIQKPYSLDRLMDVVQRILDSPA